MSLSAACVEEVHDTPLAPIWMLFSDFGNWTKWFPLIEEMRIINNKKGLGAVRKFETFVGALYEEELVELNDSEHFLQYVLLSIKPAFPGVTRVKTTIKLEAISEKETKIHWSTALDLVPELDPTTAKLTLGKAKALQESIFHIGIQALLQSIYINKYMKDVSSIFTDKAMTITRSLLKARSNVWEYADYPSHWGSLPKMVKGLPASEAIAPHKMGEMNGRILEVGYLQIANALKAVTNLGAPKKSNDIDFKKEYLNLAAYGHDFTEEEHNIAKRLVEKWDDDVEFCQQLLQGVNPLHIRMVRKMHEIPVALAHLTITEKSGEIKSLQQLVGEKRLFILDYRHLSDFVLHEKKFFYPAVMLVYREILDENNSRLNVVGIQLDPTMNEIFTPDMPQKNRYKLARMFVACVDNQCHEFQYHLHSHLSMEPVIVAIHNRLPKASKRNPESKTHPLRALLEPHCKGTIGINFVARTFLISEEDNLTDKFFAVGTKQGIKLASKGWQNYHFFKSSFPEDLKARGFDGTDGVQNYLYRDYGFKLWNAIGDYITDAVNHIYADDEAVKSDSDLQKWADEMSSRDGANITGFPETINTKKLLAHVLQIIIWHGSAFHSVLDFPQFTYIGLAYNRPSCFFSPMPELGEDGADIDDEFIQKSLSSKPGLLYKLTMSWLLSTPSEANLTDLAALKGIHDDVDVRFQENLTRISSEMKARNTELEAEGKAPYIYLLPERVACSTDI